MTRTQETTEMLLPTAGESAMARESSQRLSHLLGGLKVPGETSSPSGPIEIEIRLDGEHEVVALPSAALLLLNEILTQMAQGNAISILPQKIELTTMQASSILNVSRPYFIGLLDKGDIPHHKVGTHRRVLLEDVMRYKRDVDEKRLSSLRQLSELSEELGLDD